MGNDKALDRSILLIRLVCFGFITFAVLWWSAVFPGYDLPAKLILDISDWPIDGNYDQLEQSSRLLSAIGSGLLAGLSFLLLLVVVPEIKKGNGSVISGAIASVLAWYVVDSVGCVLIGIYSNAVLNTVYAILIIVPLLMARSAIRANDI